MKIKLTSVFVNNQDQAAAFYTGKLGFQVKMNMEMGDFKFITLVSADEPDGTELLLEPNSGEEASRYQQGIYGKGIPAVAFVVEDVFAEYKRLTELGVQFRSEPTNNGYVIAAVLDDTCGNWIQLYQPLS
ncbi:glyoxalase [Pedobacter yulinensis]|uniref:Glyoxalase n=1 Tax=Pedobacter yulinensis TaxID=2126353 RepID=A0A2T3HK53_9SPHI|nr:VOC family protein [Pedobacter yulinensis]PST82822.1 glyoxalase [Pedobacter yulinensis]